MPLRPPLKNNAPLALLLVLALLALLLGIQLLLSQSGALAPDFLASALLYGLTVLDLTLFLILLLILGRNIARALMERRRGVLGARFRLRLLIVFTAMAVGPALLLLLIGSNVIRHTVDRWFNVDVERILSASGSLGTALRESLTEQTRLHARLLAREIERRGLLEREGQSRLRAVVEGRARDLRLDMVSVFGRAGELVAVASPQLPSPSLDQASAVGLAEQALAGRETAAMVPFGPGELVRVAVPIGWAPPRGAVIVSTFLPGEVAGSVREVEERYARFQQTRNLREPIKSLYVALYLFSALLVLFGASWLALYLAGRITTPLRLVSLGAERIAAGERGVRVEFPTGNDEFGALIASFNRMSERLARSEEELEYSREGLARKNVELEARQRLLEAVLETIGAGVVAADAGGAITTINPTATRLFGLSPASYGRRLVDVLSGPGRQEIGEMVQRLLSGRVARQEREVEVPSEDGTARHLAVIVVPLASAPGEAPGAVVVADDLTPLIRAQRIAAWGEVARKLAHEIKNPLTPIQLSAQRVRKSFLRQAPDFEKILTESTRTIVSEVEALRNLVDEFAHFARFPDARPVPSMLDTLVDQTLLLYDGLYRDVRFVRRLDKDLPRVRLDPQQMKRALVNLIDNAIEALQERGTVEIAARLDASGSRVEIAVADDGPGVPPDVRERLFEPNFSSTKKRGSGLGLAVVNRIVQEHKGALRVEANAPRGARLVIELPL